MPAATARRMSRLSRVSDLEQQRKRRRSLYMQIPEGSSCSSSRKERPPHVVDVYAHGGG